ncbi:MAG: tetratricopeptide repeat protein [Planctomycetota bacterium]|jgi:hypothetical protein
MAGPVARLRAIAFAVTVLALSAAPGPAGEPPPDPGRGKRTRLARTPNTNVIDASLFDLAEFYLNEGRADDGVAVLERIARETPDSQARSIAHYNLATIHETTLNDPDRARSEYAKVTGPWAAAARGKVLRPLRMEKRWVEAVDFLKECLAAAEEPSEKAGVVRTLVMIVRSSGDDKLIEATLRSVPDLITYEEARAAAEADRKKLEEMRRRTEAAGPQRAPGPGAARRPDPRRAGARPVRKPPGGGAAAPARPVRSAAEIEAQIRELERAGFDDEARRLRQELRKLKEGQDPEQF